MKVFAIERRSAAATPELVEAHMEAEARATWELHLAGLVREVYTRIDGHGSVLVLECADEAEAARVVGHLPLVKAGLAAFDLVPVHAYRPFELLFAARDETRPT